MKLVSARKKYRIKKVKLDWKIKMKIEEHWYDGVEYYIEFKTNCERVIRKNLIFPIQLTVQEVEEIVVNRFRSVQKVIVVVEIHDVLLPKSVLMIVGEANGLI